MLRTLSVALILAAGSGLAHADADIYRWKDAQGTYHYSDQWVPGSELIKSNKQHPSAADSSAPRSSSAANDSDAPPDDSPSAATAQAVKQDVTKVRDQQCKDAKDAYDRAIHARRIFKSSKDGEREYMSDADADAYRLKIRSQMDQLCGTSTR